MGQQLQWPQKGSSS